MKINRAHFTRHFLGGRRAATLLTAMAAALTAVALPTAAAAEFMFRAQVGGAPLEGKPLTWSAEQMILLGRDGRLYDFHPRDARHAQRTGPRFAGYSMTEMRRELEREFGRELDVTTARHYIVVHPRGQENAWAGRFEELYRSCLHYFRVRGFTPAEPPYPLVAIVYRNQADYFDAAAASGSVVQPTTLGHYDLNTNRVLLYDATAGSSGDWSENAATIIHEATHQTAYNTGIHSRFTEAPRWLIEGLATMFEARGVWNAQSFHSLRDRINHGRLRDFRDRAKSRSPGTLAQLIASDQMFRSDALTAYAEAWALSFYLCETRPRQYVDYLAKTAQRPMFRPYSDAQRVADFTEAFGSDLRQLDANFLIWMAELK